MLHSGQIQKMSIADVTLIDLEVHVDSRGIVYEVVHESDFFVNQIRQVYQVVNPRADTIRAFHAHEQLHDWFHITCGSAIFCLVDDRQEGATYQATERLVLTAKKPQLLVVPPGVYHGWMSLEPNTVLASVASEEYQRDQPDERRVPPDTFNHLFHDSPWTIDAK